MRHLLVTVLAVTSLVVGVGCAAAAPGWQGSGIHLVDGIWIGIEQNCSSGVADRDLECRTVRDEVLLTLPVELGAQVTRAAVAVLPTIFMTASGETRKARLGQGINRLEAVVLDLTDGTRRVVGVSCLLPYDGAGHLWSADARCFPAILDWWFDGGAPPSIPPGAVFG